MSLSKINIAEIIGIAVGTVLQAAVCILIPGSNIVVELIVGMVLGILGGLVLPLRAPVLARA